VSGILIFGASGQLGQEILFQAAARQIESFGATRAQADLSDSVAVSALITAVRPRLIVNCAAYTAVDRAESDPVSAWEVNVIGAANVARAATAAEVPLVHLSTDYVFDGTKSGGYVEDDVVAPINVYGRTKAEGEVQVRAIAPRHIILRTAWLYGRFGNNFLNTMLRIAGEQTQLRVVVDQKGCPTATQDLAEAIFAIDKKICGNEQVVWGIYHFAGAGTTSWHGFAEQIIAIRAHNTNLRPLVLPITTADYPTLARRPRNSELDSSRFSTAFQYRAAPWQARVAELVDTLAIPAEAP
jgi:dTDP-4-dehydrorhamnose reductase